MVTTVSYQTYTGTDGDDSITLGNGNYKILGRSGIDTVIFSGLYSSYALTLDSVGTPSINGFNLNYFLVGIETLKFDDVTINIGNQGPGKSEFRAALSGGGSYFPSVSTLSDGGWVITWKSDGDSFSGPATLLQRYDKDGFQNSELTVVSTAQENYPKIVGLANGGFVDVYVDNDGLQNGIFAKVYSDDGTSIGNAIQINTTTLGQQLQPSIVSLQNGGWVATWTSQESSASAETNIYAQIFDPSGNKVNGEIKVNTTSNLNGADYTKILNSIDDQFVVSWSSYIGQGISVLNQQIFDSSGNKVGSEQIVSSNGSQPSIASLQNGGWINVWMTDTAAPYGANMQIFGQRYDANGLAIGSTFQISSDISDRHYTPQVTGIIDGGWVVTYQSWLQDGSDMGIYAQRYDLTSTKVGSEFLVNTTTSGGQCDPSITSLSDGGWIIAWHSQDSLGYSIFTQRYDLNGSPVGALTTEIIGDSSSQTILGTTNNDAIYAGSGNDVVNAGLGNDLIIGGNGAGNDVYNGGAGIDTVKYTSALSGITVNLSAKTGTATSTSGGDAANIGNDTLTGIENIIAGNYDDTLIGSSANNVFTGEGGNDNLTGLGGVDVLNGQEGSDLYVMTLAADHTAAEINDTGSSGIDEVRFTTAKASTLTLYAGDQGIESVVIGTGTSSSAVTTGITANNINASAVTNALSITGNNGNNSLIGTAYADTLTGNAGNDVLSGGAGADTLIGGIGNDTYVIDNIGDTITEGASAGTDLVQSSISYILGSNLENLTLTGSSNINSSGNTLANTITGNAGNNILDGGDGVDALVGGAGNDTYIVDVITATGLLHDTMTEVSNAGTDTIELRGTYSGVVKVITLATNFENLDISNTGSSLYNLTGNTVANSLIGNDANNTMNGGKGADILTGGSGKDTFVFTTGDSGQTALTLDKIADYTKGALGTGDLIDYVSNLTVGGSAATATSAQASINMTTGVATFATGSGTTLSDALLDVTARMTAATNTKGEFVLFKVNGTGDYYAFISDGTAGVGANDVLIQLVGITSISGIDLTGGNLTITG